MSLTFENICPGYVPWRTGANGVCCCGLYWEGHMPLHDRHGRRLDEKVIKRFARRALEADETLIAREAVRREIGTLKW